MNDNPDSFDNFDIQNDSTEDNTSEDKAPDMQENLADIPDSDGTVPEENVPAECLESQIHAEAQTAEEAFPDADAPAHASEQQDQVIEAHTIKKGFPTAFWIIWAIAALFDCLVLLVGSQHYTSLIVSAAILGAALLLRKAICRNTARLVLSWLLILLLLFTIIGFAAASENGVSLLSSCKSTASEYTNGEVSFTKEGFARTVDPNNYKPLEKSAVFTDRDKMIHYVVLFKNMPTGLQIYARWTHNRSGDSLDFSQKIEQELKNYYYDFYMTVQPGKQLPKGDYTLEITGSRGSEVLFRIRDQFRVAQ